VCKGRLTENLRLLDELRWFSGVAGGLRFSRQLEFDPEDAALANGAFNANPAVHCIHQPLADHQADARTFFARHLLTQTIEWLEELRQLFGGQSLAGIANADTHRLRRARGARQANRAAGFVVLDCVGQQVDDHLFHPCRVSIDRATGFEGCEGHADAMLLRFWFHHGLAIAQDLGQRDRFHRQRQLPGLDQRQIENLVDQPQQVPPGLENLIDASLLRGCWRRRPRVEPNRSTARNRGWHAAVVRSS
jgi:hypothetical protein